jgi:predicted type IV restriction endonuclease
MRPAGRADVAVARGGALFAADLAGGRVKKTQADLQPVAKWFTGQLHAGKFISFVGDRKTIR